MTKKKEEKQEIRRGKGWVWEGKDEAPKDLKGFSAVEPCGTQILNQNQKEEKKKCFFENVLN